MHTKRTAIALAAATALIAPAAAQAKPISTYYADGHVTIREARSETRDLFGDKEMRASEFRAPFTLFDGTPSSIEDPAVASTRYQLDGCKPVNRRTVDCTVGISAWRTSPHGTPYRWAMATVRTHAASRKLGSTGVISETFGGATPPPAN